MRRELYSIRNKIKQHLLKSLLIKVNEELVRLQYLQWLNLIVLLFDQALQVEFKANTQLIRFEL